MLSCLIDQNTTIILCKLRRKIAKGTCQQMSLHFASLGQSLWSTMHTYFREEKRWKFGSGCKINLRRPCFAKQGSQPFWLLLHLYRSQPELCIFLAFFWQTGQLHLLLALVLGLAVDWLSLDCLSRLGILYTKR